MVEARQKLWGHCAGSERPEDQTTKGCGMEPANRGIYNPTSIQQQQEFQMIPNKLIEFDVTSIGHVYLREGNRRPRANQWL